MGMPKEKVIEHLKKESFNQLTKKSWWDENLSCSKKNCHQPFEIKNVLVDVYFFFEDNVLDRISFFFSSKNYEIIKEALIEKYNKPECSYKILQNRMGAKFEDETCIWKLVNGVVVISRYGGSDLDNGVAFFESPEAYKRHKEEKRKQRSLPGF